MFLSFSIFSPYLNAGKREILADYALPTSVLVMAFIGSYVFSDVKCKSPCLDFVLHEFNNRQCITSLVILTQNTQCYSYLNLKLWPSILNIILNYHFVIVYHTLSILSKCMYWKCNFEHESIIKFHLCFSEAIQLLGQRGVCGRAPRTANLAVHCGLSRAWILFIVAILYGPKHQ